MVLKISGGGNRRRDTWRVAIGSIQAGGVSGTEGFKQKGEGLPAHIYIYMCVCCECLAGGPYTSVLCTVCCQLASAYLSFV